MSWIGDLFSGGGAKTGQAWSKIGMGLGLVLTCIPATTMLGVAVTAGCGSIHSTLGAKITAEKQIKDAKEQAIKDGDRMAKLTTAQAMIAGAEGSTILRAAVSKAESQAHNLDTNGLNGDYTFVKNSSEARDGYSTGSTVQE